MAINKVHLVGSVGLDSVREVFRVTGKLLGRRLRRVPDGEPGGRRTWITWQYAALRGNPYLAVNPEAGLRPTTGIPLLCLAPGVTPNEVRFGELGYAREARASYEDFLEARKQGELPAGIRFQVCLPTPFAVAYAYCPGKDMSAIENAYEKAMLGEVETICHKIPHKDLCLQWDLAIEMVLWDGRWEGMANPFTDLKSEVMTRMKRLCAAVPGDVELGFHLCYGDWGAKHFIEPLDAGKLVEIANALARTVMHPIAYIHMPVPIERTDEAYFQPLRNLVLAQDTELYLGMVHLADGVDGVTKRATAASRYVQDFGIATECGMGRCKTLEMVTRLLEIHAAGTREPTATRRH